MTKTQFRDRTRRAKTLSGDDFDRWCPDEDAAVAILEKAIWGGTPKCPHCHSEESTPRPGIRGHRCRNKSCRRDFTARMWTSFRSSRLPVRKWLKAMRLHVQARNSISAMELRVELGISYHSAWYMLKRIQLCCDQLGIVLTGDVQVDESYFGGLERYKPANKRTNVGGGVGGKIPIIAAMDENGQVIVKQLADDSQGAMIDFVREHVPAGTGRTVITDGHQNYVCLRDAYHHVRVDHGRGRYSNGGYTTNPLEAIWKIMKTAYRGTFTHWSRKYAQLYVDEFAFRQNEGHCCFDTVDRIDALLRRSVGKYMSFKDLTKDREDPAFA